MKRLAKVAWQKLRGGYRLSSRAAASSKTAQGGAGPFQPSRSERRTAAAGRYALALIARTHDPFSRSTRGCEQISCSISLTSISLVGRHSNVLGISPGQMRHAEPSLSSTIWLLSCFLICIADLRAIESECCIESGSIYQGRRDASHPARLLERLFGRRANALTDFFANAGIVLRHFQNRTLSPTRESLIGNCFCQGMDGLIQDFLLISGGRRSYPLLIVLLEARHLLDGGRRRIELLVRDIRRLVGEIGRRRLHLSVRRGNEEKPRGN